MIAWGLILLVALLALGAVAGLVIMLIVGKRR